MKKCPECNSEKIIRDAKTVNTDGSELKMAVDEQPDALIMKKRSLSDVNVEICGECGFIQFYTADPKTLWTAYQNRQKNV